MTVHVVTHRDCLAHDPGPGHPERPDRLAVLLEALDDPTRWEGLCRHEAPAASDEALLLVHPASYLSALEGACARVARLDPDTVVGGASWSAARRAAGAAVGAAELALAGRGNAFAVVRPPGHHALAARAMGFCLLNNVVIAARAAAVAGGLDRVLVVDWDVHHGNGTQALVEHDAGMRFVSLHQWPWYPGTGRAEERGIGNIWNLPRPPGLARREYVAALLEGIDAATREWTPQLVMISAGFDSMAGDPLGGFTLEPDDYVEMVDRLAALDAPLCAVLEGGYDLGNLVAGVTRVLAALA